MRIHRHVVTCVAILFAILANSRVTAAPATRPASPVDALPPHITRLTWFGERADWSHDGRRILFLAKTFGDVYEIELATRIIRPITHHYFHEGYTRALYLANGDILLSGAREFHAKDPWPSRNSRAELWVLKKDLSGPPVPLGEKCSEGPAVSRKHMRIAWTVDHGDEPGQMPEGVSQIWTADLTDEAGGPKLSGKRKLLDSRDLPFKAGLETQSFRPPREQELIFSAYGYDGTEVMGLNLQTGAVVNYSKAQGQYDEPEGICPDGRHTLVECDRHDPRGSQHIDIYKLALDGSGRTQRLTQFNDDRGYKASNPVVSDDGRFMAFQFARVGDPAGVGRGILVYDFEKAPGSESSAAAARTELSIQGTRFAINGRPTFLLGISYYGGLGASEDALHRDLDDMQQAGVNWLRVWATWSGFENDVSAVDGEGQPRQVYLGRLKTLVAECDRRGMVIDVTLSRGNGVAGSPRLQTPRSHRRAVATLVEALREHRNWYLDLANERNIRDARHVSDEELGALRKLVRELDPKRLVTASHAGDIDEQDLRDYLTIAGVDFLSPHRPRNPESPRQTERRTRQYLAWTAAASRPVPVHYQEPFRRGFQKDWDPSAEDLLTDLEQARAGGAAGWCLHNGDQRGARDARPRRSFDLRDGRLFDQLDEQERKVVAALRQMHGRDGRRPTQN